MTDAAGSVEALLAQFGDGHVRRLRRGRDFDESPRLFRKSVTKRARTLGRPVHVVLDKLAPEKYVWIQVGDASIRLGEPCVCGSTAIDRLHKFWGRCKACHRLLELQPREPQEPDPGAAAGPDGAGLDAYADVSLYRYRVTADEEWCYGSADDGTGKKRLIAVVFPLDDGGRIADPERSGQWLYGLHEVEDRYVLPLLDAADVERGPRVSWRIDEDQGPDQADIATLD